MFVIWPCTEVLKRRRQPKKDVCFPYDKRKVSSFVEWGPLEFHLWRDKGWRWSGDSEAQNRQERGWNQEKISVGLTFGRERLNLSLRQGEGKRYRKLAIRKRRGKWRLFRSLRARWSAVGLGSALEQDRTLWNGCWEGWSPETISIWVISVKCLVLRYVVIYLCAVGSSTILWHGQLPTISWSFLFCPWSWCLAGRRMVFSNAERMNEWVGAKEQSGSVKYGTVPFQLYWSMQFFSRG